jgi:hypothetical protein
MGNAKPIGVAGIRKLNSRLLNVAASLAQRIGHGLDHPESLLANGEIDEQNPRECCAHARCSLVCCYRRLGQETPICQRWDAMIFA